MWLVGHPGYGGQNVKTDFKNGITIAYLTNSLQIGMGDLSRSYMNVQRAVYASLQD